MLTLYPARHLGLDGEIGSIAPGKRADLVAFHVRSGFGDVERVWVGGEERFSAPQIEAKTSRSEAGILSAVAMSE
jgi:imidazolonepropionase-like amidohydrolase